MALPWLLRMRWTDLLFAHWPLPAEPLRQLLPDDPDLELDLFDGTAWLGVVPFTMSDVSPRGLPAIPRFSAFPELNVRTYVRHRGRPGVWFISLDARSRPTVVGGRTAFHLPYRHAEMSSIRHGDTVSYRSERPGRGPSARFVARYRPVGEVMSPERESFETWATVRMRLFSADRTGRIWRTEIDHGPWPLQRAEAALDATDLVAADSLSLPNTDPVLHFAGRLDVHGWLPVPAG